MSKLMISVAGIRGVVGETLTPEVILKFALAFGTQAGPGKIVVGSDTRVTGPMVKHAVIAGLQAVGCTVIDVGICPTPTVQMATEKLSDGGGIIITASHNPIEWNALKLLSKDGLFLTAEAGKQLQELVQKGTFNYVAWDRIGHYQSYEQALSDHQQAILALPYLDLKAIQKRRFKVALDCVNGAGSVMLPEFLRTLGCDVHPINCTPDGLFPHTPEPVPENLTQLCDEVRKTGADLGFAVDPDSDRLAIIANLGLPLGEEYTLALVTDFILKKKRGPVVLNASTSLAAEDIARAYGVDVLRTKVGESHVAQKMAEIGAVIGGEGNGGVMLPDLHLGRDAIVGVA
ncbi:phosphoglucosamine mutase, partial [candidate division KSB1 bacterium]|nr:phosphoglucosamine mutase [candidate division KSB1 bacterium]